MGEESIEPLIEGYEKEKAQCEELVERTEELLQKSRQPQPFWLEAKKETEKRIKEIDRRLENFKNFLKKF